MKKVMKVSLPLASLLMLVLGSYNETFKCAKLSYCAGGETWRHKNKKEKRERGFKN